ncbi:MAG: hypothetical protein ACJAT2_001571 [Bacteriovoracaceae bacterium]|jgi:hypothetical protein
MIELRSKEEIYRIWTALGVAFSSEPMNDIPPERALLETIRSIDIDRDRKIFSLVLVWLETYGDHIRFEPIYHFLESMTDQEMRVLGAISLKLSKESKRWLNVVKKINKRLNPSFDEMKLSDSRRLEARGVDKDFEIFDLLVSPIATSDSSKLMSMDHIIKNNYWIRNRIMLGNNLRADVISSIDFNPAPSRYSSAKLIGCRDQSIYGPWREVERVKKVMGL